MYLRLQHPPLLLFERRALALEIIAAASLLPAGGADAMVEARSSAAVAFPAESALKDDGVLLVGVEVAGPLPHWPPRRHRQPRNAEQVLDLVRLLPHPEAKLSVRKYTVYYYLGTEELLLVRSVPDLAHLDNAPLLPEV
jgi:hypothetical protein